MLCTNNVVQYIVGITTSSRKLKKIIACFKLLENKKTKKNNNNNNYYYYYLYVVVFDYLSHDFPFATESSLYLFINTMFHISTLNCVIQKNDFSDASNPWTITVLQ